MNRTRFVKTGQEPGGEVDGYIEHITDAEEAKLVAKETQWPPDKEWLTHGSTTMCSTDMCRILLQCVDHIIALERKIITMEALQ
jgi:hypothetical protein